jgi:hypothetical protein
MHDQLRDMGSMIVHKATTNDDKIFLWEMDKILEIYESD